MQKNPGCPGQGKMVSVRYDSLIFRRVPFQVFLVSFGGIDILAEWFTVSGGIALSVPLKYEPVQIVRY